MNPNDIRIHYGPIPTDWRRNVAYQCNHRTRRTFHLCAAAAPDKSAITIVATFFLTDKKLTATQAIRN